MTSALFGPALLYLFGALAYAVGGWLGLIGLITAHTYLWWRAANAGAFDSE
jgi:hypothetical protein